MNARAARATLADPGGDDLRPDLSLVFPVFDEERNLPELIRTARQIAAWLAPEFEIIVVDDGSRDASADIALGWATLDPRVRLVRHGANTGYGAALRTGLKAARGELIFFSDADLQFDLAELEKLLEHTGHYDIVAGYRSPRRDPWPRLVLAWGWGVLVRTIFGLQVRDIDCAFKVFRRHVIERLDTESLGAFINTELLVRARTAGFRVHQVPVAHRRRRHGRQSGASPRVIAKALAELLRLHRGLRASADREQAPGLSQPSP
jgi:glycosyltransferase involved in cell wall biosynthesis